LRLCCFLNHEVAVVEHLQGPVRFPLFSAGWQRRLFKSNPFRIKTILIQMKLRFQHDCSGIDWETIPAILETVGMSFHDSDIHRRTFLASSAVVFVFDDQQLVGFGRAISDGFIQAAIYDVAVCLRTRVMVLENKLSKRLWPHFPDVILSCTPLRERSFFTKS
jgi:hypothetical protein